MSTTIYSITASRAIRTSSAVECHQEPFSFPLGFSESPTPASAEGASYIQKVVHNLYATAEKLPRIRQRSFINMTYFILKRKVFRSQN